MKDHRASLADTIVLQGVSLLVKPARAVLNSREHAMARCTVQMVNADLQSAGSCLSAVLVLLAHMTALWVQLARCNADCPSKSQVLKLACCHADADGGGERTVQLSKLTAEDRKLLVKGILRSQDQDHEAHLQALHARLARHVCMSNVAQALAGMLITCTAQGRDRACDG